MAYNWGPGNVVKRRAAGQGPIPDETTSYVGKVRDGRARRQSPDMGIPIQRPQYRFNGDYITDQVQQAQAAGELDTQYGWNVLAGRPYTQEEGIAAGTYAPDIPALTEPIPQANPELLTAPIHEGLTGHSGARAIPDVPPVETTPETPWWAGDKWEEENIGMRMMPGGAGSFGIQNEMEGVQNPAYIDHINKSRAAGRPPKSYEEFLAFHTTDPETGQAPVDRFAMGNTMMSDEQRAHVAAVEASNDVIEAGGTAEEADKAAAEAAKQELGEKPKVSEEEVADELSKYFAEPPAEDDTGPGADQPGNNADSGTVTNEGEKEIKKPGAWSKFKQMADDWGIGDLFDDKELKRMAVMYLGSRALGYSHNGSLRWSAGQYINRIDAKQGQIDKLLASGKYTPSSVAEYKKTGDISTLRPPGATYNPTGNATVKMVGGKKVALQEVKDKNGAVYYQGPKGQLFTAAQIATERDYEPSFDKGTPEYRERRNRARTNSEARFEEVFKAEDRFRVGENEWKTTTNIRPKQAADEFWAWSESMGLDPESDEALQIMTNAYQEAIVDGKGGDVKPSSLKPYLENQYIREKSGSPELFITNEPKPGEKPQYVRGDKMQKLDRNVKFVATQLPALQGLSDKDAADRFYQMAVEEWGQLGDQQKFYNDSAEKGESGFYYFINKRANDLLQRLGG